MPVSLETRASMSVLHFDFNARLKASRSKRQHTLSRGRTTAWRRLAHQLTKQLRRTLVDHRGLVVPLLPADAKGCVQRRIPALVFGIQLRAALYQKLHG